MKIKNTALVTVLSGLGFVGLASAAEPVPSATISRVEGNAIASQEARYLPAREGMVLKEGDRLMVLEGGTAVISYADGCQYTLKEMGVLVVQKMSTCALNGAGVYNYDPRTAVASGNTPPMIQAQTVITEQSALDAWLAANGLTLDAAITAGVVVAVGATGWIVYENNNDGGNPPSPTI